MKEEITEEIWKGVPGFEDTYEVSNLGRVKSLVKPYRRTERILKGSPITTGYIVVQLYLGKCTRKSFLVHRLVMIAFQPNPAMDQLEVNHKDLDCTNNNMTNLEWILPEGNKKHYQQSEKFIEVVARATKGESHHLSVMTDEKVIELRRRWELVKGVYGERSKLAREFGINEGTARLITDGKTWKHLL